MKGINAARVISFEYLIFQNTVPLWASLTSAIAVYV